MASGDLIMYCQLSFEGEITNTASVLMDRKQPNPEYNSNPNSILTSNPDPKSNPNPEAKV